MICLFLNIHRNIPRLFHDFRNIHPDGKSAYPAVIDFRKPEDTFPKGTAFTPVNPQIYKDKQYRYSLGYYQSRPYSVHFKMRCQKECQAYRKDESFEDR